MSQINEYERKILEAIRDGSYTTISQVAKDLDISYKIAVHYVMKMRAHGYLNEFEVTYQGYKYLEGSPFDESDQDHNVKIRHVK